MKKFKSKKIKKSKKNRKLLKFLIFIFTIYFFSYFTFNYLDNKISYTSNKNFLGLILNTSNLNTKKESSIKYLNNIIENVTKVNFSDPISVLDEGIKNNIIKISSEKEEDTYDNYTELEKVSNHTINQKDSKINKPLLYIYNSHQLENYTKGDSEDIPNVMLTSYKLKEKLKDYNIDSIVEEENIQEILRINSWNGSSAYKASRILINNAIENYSSLKYFVDLHRDSVGYNYTTLKTEDKNFAKIYFVIGLEHKNYEKNLEFATKLSNMLNNEINGISKGILAKQGENVNGIYNQDINNNVLLIEIGGVDNTINEVYNTIDILAKVLKNYIKGDKT